MHATDVQVLLSTWEQLTSVLYRGSDQGDCDPDFLQKNHRARKKKQPLDYN